MKVRVIQTQSGAWYGEVYGTWESIFGKTWTGWKKVTSNCITKMGAKIELKNWKKKNVPQEFDI